MTDCNQATACSAPERKLISQDILEFLDRLASDAEAVSRRLEDKLHPICTTAGPTGGEGEGVEREYPPLFSEMRERLITIDRAISRITEVLGRVEV